MTKPGKGVLFTLMLTAAVGLFLWLTLDLSRNARLVPLVVVVPTLGFLVFQALLDVVPSLAALRARLEKSDLFGIESLRQSSPPSRDPQSEGPAEEGVMRRRESSVISWILLLLVSIDLLGFLFAVPLFTFLYLKGRAGESWRLSLAAAIGAGGVLYGVFVLLVHVRLHEGRVWPWLGL